MAADSLYPTGLTDRHIRLIKILPSRTQRLPVLCELQQYDMDDVPAYEALSYCWGDAKEKSSIVCNGSTHFITANLHDALFRLRLENECRMVWADALSINQSNDEEKSYQVSLMGRIYSQSERTVVWLGRAKEEDLKPIRNGLDAFSEVMRSYGIVKGSSPEPLDKFLPIKMPSELLESLPWKAIRTLFRAPWFQRIWCVQEVRLASATVIYWSGEELSWDAISGLASWMSIAQGMRGPSRIPLTLSKFAVAMVLPIESPASKLLDTLATFRSFQATDPRDKVYGLLSLTELSDERQMIQVDYAKSVAEVYIDVAVFGINQTQDLSLFRHISHPQDYNDDPGFASWAPRWDQWGALIMNPDISGKPPLRDNRIPLGFNGAAGASNGQLKLNGLLFDTVRAVDMLMDMDCITLEGPPIDEGMQCKTHPYLDYWRYAVSSNPPSGFISQPEVLSMARTITAGQVSRFMDYRHIEEAEMKVFLERFLDYISTLFIIFEDDDQDESKPRAVRPQTGYWRLFAHTASRWGHHRRLFITRNGSYGLGPACLREDDLIVELAGGDTPYALRRRGDNYLMLGQVYIDTIMEEELVRDMEVGLIQKQEFCLI